MSHFTVLVIGDDHDYQLSPFHEFECTGYDDEFVKDIDQTEEARSDYERHKNDPNYKDFTQFVEDYYGRSKVPFGETVNTEDEDYKYGYFTVDENGEVLKVINRTNPNSKWDWYLVGGRWSDFFKMKPGKTGKVGERGFFDTEGHRPGYADQVLKGDIDFEGMIAESYARHAEWYRKSGYNQSMTWRTWDDVLKDETFENIDAKREFYHSQPDLLAVKENFKKNGEDIWFLTEVDDLVGKSEFEYASKNARSSIVPFALVEDRNWYQRGEMGWFGASTEEIPYEEWADFVLAKINDLPDDTVLTLVDCHI